MTSLHYQNIYQDPDRLVDPLIESSNESDGELMPTKKFKKKDKMIRNNSPANNQDNSLEILDQSNI